MRVHALFAGALSAGFLLGGCAVVQENQPEKATPVRPVVEAAYAPEGVQIDGKLDDAVWSRAKSYPLNLNPAWNAGQPPLTRESLGTELHEGGNVRVAWDDENLYVAFDCVDSDVIAQNTADQTAFFVNGDLGEVFLKPANDSYYWELYVNPVGNKTSFFFPSRSHRGLPDMSKELLPSLRTAGDFAGSLNNWHDRDQGWSGEMAVSFADLEQHGMKFDADTPWTIFFGRYNYSRYLPDTELSCFPVVPNLNYHLTEYYADLKLTK